MQAPYRLVLEKQFTGVVAAGTSSNKCWVQLLLKVLAATDTSTSTYSNPYAEVLKRVAAIDGPNTGFAYQELATFFGNKVDG